MLHSLLADGYFFWLPHPAAKNAADVDPLFYFILFINIFFSSLIMFLMAVFVIKYRHREGKHHDPTGGHSTALELTWTIIPTLLVLVIFWYGFRGYLHANIMPPNAYEVTANGQMWKWSFTYPTGLTDDELHLVVNQPTKMILQSADVIHDLDIPSFRMKKDVVPGRFNRMWFEPTVASAAPQLIQSWHTDAAVPPVAATDGAGYYGLFKNGDNTSAVQSIDLSSGDTVGFEKPGGSATAVYIHDGAKTSIPLTEPGVTDYSWKKIDFYQVYCAMYCGTQHSTMLAKCIVQDQASFDRWMEDKLVWEPKMSYIQRGKDLHSKMGCISCHSVDGSTGTGPTWKDLYGSSVQIEGQPSVTADDAYLVESITEPGAKIVQGFKNVMPGNFKSQLKPNDLTALVWFMKSISTHYSGSLEEGNRVGAAKAPPRGPAQAQTSGPATAPVTLPPAVPEKDFPPKRPIEVPPDK